MDFLSSLDAKINIADPVLEMKKASLQSTHTVPLNMKIRLSLPVNIMEGDFLFETTTLNNDLSITGGLYTALDGLAHFEVCNTSDYDQTLFLEEPLQAEMTPIRDYEYLNCMFAGETPQPTDIQTKLDIETGHLNNEETQNLLKPCKQSPYTQNPTDSLLYTRKKSGSKFQRFSNRILSEIAIPLGAHLYGSCLRKPIRQVRKSGDW